jgi:hypothetical protein
MTTHSDSKLIPAPEDAATQHLENQPNQETKMSNDNTHNHTQSLESENPKPAQAASSPLATIPLVGVTSPAVQKNNCR